jgi:hypothetical protein
MQPINYLTQVADPFAEALQGVKIGAGLADLEAQRALQARQQQQQQLAVQEQARFFSNPNPTMRDAARYASLLTPEQSKAFLPFMEGISKEQQQGILKSTGQVLSALQTNPEVGIKLLQDRALAARNSGDQEDAALFDQMAEAAADPKRGPAIVFKSLAARTAGIPGSKEFFENIDKSLSTQRAEALQPSVLKESIAKAEKAVSDALVAKEAATNAPAVAKADADLKTAQAQEAAVKAKFAEREAIDAIIKRGADLNLTKAQTDSALAQGRKLGAEASMAILELEALKKGGTLATPKAFEQEEKLRKEFQARTKVYGELGTTFSNIKSSAAAKTGPGDIALITGFMKMLDPGSVVRETEFATARDTAGLYERLLNTSQKLQSGQLFTLDSNQRQEYVNLAKQYLDSAQKKAGDDKKALGVVVKNYRLNPDNVFGPETTEAPTAEKVSVTFPNGKVYEFPNQAAADAAKKAAGIP